MSDEPGARPQWLTRGAVSVRDRRPIRRISAVGGVSFDAHQGEVIGIIGPNGAGKTTLFDVISGVRIPDAGRVCLVGEDVTRTPATTRAQCAARR